MSAINFFILFSCIFLFAPVLVAGFNVTAGFPRKNVFLQKKMALDFLSPDFRIGLLSRSRRNVIDKTKSTRELGPNEIFERPWTWIIGPAGVEMFDNYKFKELREIRRYPGAWYKKPDNFKFSYMPNEGEFQRRIINNGEGKGEWVYMYLWEVKMQPELRSEYKHDSDFFSIYWRYAQCVRNVQPYRNCPDPCNEEGICKNEPNALPGLCRSVYDPSVKVDMNKEAKDTFEKIFQRRYECICVDGFAWDKNQGKCVDVRDDCKMRISGDNPCRNGGTCQNSNNSLEGYTCRCPPAYKGDSCQLPRDACRGHTVCGRFNCRRDPSNWLLGYTCLCNEKKGWERFAVQNPFCMDVNECNTTKPCRHGSKCVNTEGSYNCACRPGWIGKHCENRAGGRPTWQAWGPYSACTQTCGTEGRESAYRKCSLTNQCSGTNHRTRKCRGVPNNCPEEELFKESVGQSYNRRQPDTGGNSWSTGGNGNNDNNNGGWSNGNTGNSDNSWSTKKKDSWEETSADDSQSNSKSIYKPGNPHVKSGCDQALQQHWLCLIMLTTALSAFFLSK